MAVFGEAPGGALIGVRPKDSEAGEALRCLTDMVEATEETPGLPSSIAQDCVYALARAYGEALAGVVRQWSRSIESSDGFAIVHELRPDSSGGRVLRIIARLGGSPNDLGGRAELATIEDTMPMMQLPRLGQESISVVGIVRKAVLAAAPELSSVTVVFGAAPNRSIEPSEALMTRSATTAARR